MTDITTIRVTTGTRDKLAKLAKYGQSLEDVILELLKEKKA